MLLNVHAAVNLAHIPRCCPPASCTEHLDSVAVQHAAALAPVIAELQEEIGVLRQDVDQQRLAAAVARQELDGAMARLQEVGLGVGCRMSLWRCARRRR